MKFSNFKTFPTIHYSVDIMWDYLESSLERYIKNYNLDMNPDFQREHVWNQEQQQKYVEFIIQGGESGRDIYFNHPTWMDSFKKVDFVLVDGKQRLEAVRKFLRNELIIFEKYKLENFEEKILPFECRFKFNIAKLPTKKDVLLWYLNFNSGGTVHTKEELNKVKKILDNISNEKKEEKKMNKQLKSFLNVIIPFGKIFVAFLLIEIMFKLFTIPSTLANVFGIVALMFFIWVIINWIYPMIKMIFLKINSLLNN